MKNLGKIDRAGGGGRWNRHRIYKQRKRHKNNFMKWILVGFLIVVIAVIIAFFVRTKEQNGTGKAVNTKTNNKEATSKKEATKSEAAKTNKADGKIQATIDAMSLEEKVAQLFIITPEALTGTGVVIQAGDTTKSCLQSYPVGGLIYFSQNIESETQLKTMLATTKAMSKYPLFLGVEEEGGGEIAYIANSGVIKVSKVSEMSAIGASGDNTKANEAGAAIGGYLSALGFNLNFAPVADVLTNSANTIIGNRSFGSDPKIVSEMVSEMVKGMQKTGISATLKHFPGAGDTLADADSGVAISERSEEQLENTEFLPFEAGIKAQANLVMVGHMAVPNITGDNTPSSLSKKIVTEILRTKLGYDGIVITDAMNMGVITDYYEPAEIGVKVLQAGGDMILMPADFKASYAGLLNAVLNGTISEDRIDESLKRIFRVKMATS